MNDAPENARVWLFGEDHVRFPLQGEGARLLLLGTDLPRGIDLGGRLVDVAPGWSAKVSSPSHALRVASICAEGDEARGSLHGSLGIAPRAQVIHASHAGLSAEELEQLVGGIRRKVGRVDVIGLAWSAEEDHHLAHAGRAIFGRWADSNIDVAAATIAAAGHDGPERLRFPASCEQVLAVGVCGPDFLPTAYCGTRRAQRKPEILVPAGQYLARTEGGGIDHLSGTSAAVAIASGCAALWCERLRGIGVEPTPPMVRAALLASAVPSPDPTFRVLSGAALWPSVSVAAQEWAYDPSSSPELHVESVEGVVRIAASIRALERTQRWVVQGPTLTLTARAVGGASATWRTSGALWAVLDVTVTPGTKLEIEASVDGSCQTIAIVAVGARQAQPARPRSRARRPLTIVGLSASHDAAACVTRDGRVEVAIPLERLTRLKHDGAGHLSSAEAAAYCLASVGLSPREVDYFAFNAQPLLPGWVGLSQPLKDADFSLFDPLGDRSIYVSHHLAHAFAAFAASPFDAATVVVCDGSGGSVAGADDLLLHGPALRDYLASPRGRRPGLHVTSVYSFDRRGFTLAFRELAESFNVRCGSSSIGEVYAAVSQYVFGSWHDSGKLMGLAPYGSPAEFGPSLLEPGEDGLPRFSAAWKEGECRADHRGDAFEYRHLAARIQADFEEAVMARVRLAVERTGVRRLVFTGGLALNCRVNERIAREIGPGSTFFFPAGHDAGIAIGAAAAAWFLRTGDHAPQICDHDFLGHPYGELDHDLAISARRAALDVAPLDLERTADRLASGAIVGWFEGASEFGPRALGHRSILADARSRDMWTRVNADVKYREDFRPLAPMVPEEEASRYFELDEPSPFMLRVVRIREPFRDRLGAVCHVDGSARVQTVNRSSMPRLHRLLLLMAERTGLPILLNTSLNRRGEPLVETPLEAIDMLLSTGLDALVLGDYLLASKPCASGEIDGGSLIAPSPGVRVVMRSSPKGPRSIIAADFRGELELPGELAAVLLHADGKTRVGELLASHLPRHFEEAMALAWLTMLYKKKLLTLHAS